MKSIEYIRIISDWEYTNSPLFNRLDWVPGLDLLSCTSCIRRRRANPRIAPVWILISLNHLIYLKWKVYFVYICLQATKPPLLSSPLSTIYTHTELFKLLNLFHFIFSIFSDPSHYLTIYCLHLLRSFSLSYNLLFTSSPIPLIISQSIVYIFFDPSHYLTIYCLHLLRSLSLSHNLLFTSFPISLIISQSIVYIFSDPSHYLTIYCLHLLWSLSLSCNLLFTSSPIPLIILQSIVYIFSDPSHYLTIYSLHLLRSLSLSYNLLFTSSPIVKVFPVLPSQNCFLSFLNCSNFICYYHCTKPISFNFKEKLKDIGLFLIF